MGAFAQQALFADLLILGQHDPNPIESDQVPADFVESVLIASGKPGLVIPYAGSFDRIGDTVVIAWKESRESARRSNSSASTSTSALALSPASAALLVLRMTREEIGSYLGLTLETVSRTLSKLAADGVLDVSRREISIRDEAALRSLANQQACHYRSAL